MSKTTEDIRASSTAALEAWLDSCRRRKHTELSRNTVAVGIVVLDHLRTQCPLARENVVGEGGEVRGARSGLRSTLARYGITQPYLKEVTTRQAHQDGQKLLEGLAYGQELARIDAEARDVFLRSLIDRLLGEVRLWFQRQHLKITAERQASPSSWVRRILAEAKGRSNGIVEQHLVGAKLQRRHGDIEIANFPSHAADLQTGRIADILVGQTAFHVTVAPGKDVIVKCQQNLEAGLYPFLLTVPEQVIKARSLAEVEGIEERMTIASIEDFVAFNIVELGAGQRAGFLRVLKEIIDLYNERLSEVETDMSLKIEIV
jgi:hypothetical protein